MKKTMSFVSHLSLKMYVTLFVGLLGLNRLAFASSNPFGSMNIDASQLEGKVGSTTMTTLMYLMVAAGVAICFVCIAGLAKIASRTADEKQEHGSNVGAILIIVVCGVLGLILVSVGWKGASATIS